jgi:hypothetical protein
MPSIDSIRFGGRGEQNFQNFPREMACPVRKNLELVPVATRPGRLLPADLEARGTLQQKLAAHEHIAMILANARSAGPIDRAKRAIARGVAMPRCRRGANSTDFAKSSRILTRNLTHHSARNL